MRGVTDERQPKRTLTADDLAGLVGDSRERIDQLTATGVIDPDADGRYAPGDAHRVRVVDGFEAAGVPLDALIRAQEAGLISVAYYDELHLPPGRPSEHTFDVFLDALGSKGELVRAALGAVGIAEPDPTSRLSLDDEAFLTDLATMMEDAGAVDLMLRVLRQFGEATRRASVAAMETTRSSSSASDRSLPASRPSRCSISTSCPGPGSRGACPAWPSGSRAST
jgi:hypothetical protein